MRPRLRLLLPVFALLLVVPAAAHAADKPTEKALYQDGPEGRYLLDGDWLFRLDNEDQGVKQRFMRQTSTSGWIKTHGPERLEPRRPVQRVDGGRDRLVPQGLRAARAPTRALAWAFRFESVNYRAKVWLNGTPLGKNTGAYIPFEIVAKALKRNGHEPARGARRLAPQDHRLPARRPQHRRRPDRRLVELLRHPARGLPAQARHSSTSRRSWSAR